MGNGKGSSVDAAPRSAGDLLAEFKLTGRQEAFEEIVRRYAAMVFGVCLKTTRNAHDAEDATQAVFLNLATHCKTGGQPITYVGPWLQKVARRVSLDIRRSKKRREVREENHATNNGNGNGNGYHNGEQAGVDVEELKVVLNDELHQLPAKYRLPMILHYYGGLTRDEIAKELGCKASTLGVRIHRGRQMLAQRLTERGAAPTHMSLGMLLTVAVRDAVSDGMIASTSKAAAELMAGKQLGAMISTHVLAVAHGAIGTALIAKLKAVAAVVVLSAVTMAAAGAVAKTLPLEDLRLRWPLNFDGFFRLPRLQSPFGAPRADATGQEPDALALAARSAAADAAVQTVMWIASDERAAGERPRPRPGASSSRTRRGPGSYGAGGRLVAQLVSAVVSANVPAPRREASGPAAAPANAPAAARDASTALASAPPVLPPARAPHRAHGAAPSSVPAGFRGAVASVSGHVTFGHEKAIHPLQPPTRMNGSSTSAGAAPPRGPVIARGPSMTVGGPAGSRGSVRIDRGVVDIDTQVIGESGHGELVQNGGTNIASAVRMGVNPGSSAFYNVRNNRLLIKGDPAAVPSNAYTPGGPAEVPQLTGIEVGHAGDALFNLGDDLGTGEVAELDSLGPVGGSLVVRGDEGGTGTFRGSGVVTMRGFLDHNGRIVADGYGHDRTLEFNGFRYVGNSFDNPAAGGGNGWFAENGGKLVLPHLRVRRGTHAYTWGDDPTDPAIDLVNSVRVTIHDAVRDGPARISLLSTDRADVPALPAGHNFIGVWQFEDGGLPHGAVDLLVRYDDGLAERLGLDENNLKLWRFHDGEWLRINDDTFFRDIESNLIGGSAGDLEYFAVSAPEPAAVALLLLGGGTLLLRRRR